MSSRKRNDHAAHTEEMREHNWYEVSRLVELEECGIDVRITVLTSEDERVCASCRALVGRHWTPTEFLADVPIPNPHCSSPTACRCTYLVDADA